jgi:hypothetical protein
LSDSIVDDSDGRSADGMSAEGVVRFRRQADGCYRQATLAINPLDREAWLLLANDWIKMAQAAEQNGWR